jgi:hypothetical protein
MSKADVQAIARTVELSGRSAGPSDNRRHPESQSYSPMHWLILIFLTLRGHHDTGKPPIEAGDSRLSGTTFARAQTATFTRRNQAPAWLGNADMR